MVACLGKVNSEKEVNIVIETHGEEERVALLYFKEVFFVVFFILNDLSMSL